MKKILRDIGEMIVLLICLAAMWYAVGIIGILLTP